MVSRGMVLIAKRPTCNYGFYRVMPVESHAHHTLACDSAMVNNSVVRLDPKCELHVQCQNQNKQEKG